MNEISLFEKTGIKDIKFEDRSDPSTRRLRLLFPNGLGISIIRGKYTYGGNEGLYEIAPLNKNGALDGSLLNLDDDVDGHLTEKEVFDYCKKIANL